ncbi:DUF7859 family protein [Halosimplex carlsbadense]|uniref:DUF7859 family protein n=1 Tax=Halosimplex carlsbadense TaxID=171164 RepID=UPI0018722813|nr:hypothetical protein [Halosimplex carlsbadense]
MQIGDLVSWFFEDPVLLAIVAILLGFVFLLYLFLRRTAKGFKEGMNQGRQ